MVCKHGKEKRKTLFREDWRQLCYRQGLGCPHTQPAQLLQFCGTVVQVGTFRQPLPLKLHQCWKWDHQFQTNCIYPEPKSFLPALVKELISGKRD